MALTPIKAIRAKCLDCSGGQYKEVTLCPVKTCSLYPYRKGHRPRAEDLAADTGINEKTEDSSIVIE